MSAFEEQLFAALDTIEDLEGQVSDLKSEVKYLREELEGQSVDHSMWTLATALDSIIRRLADAEGTSLSEFDWSEVNGVISRHRQH